MAHERHAVCYRLYRSEFGGTVLPYASKLHMMQKISDDMINDSFVEFWGTILVGSLGVRRSASGLSSWQSAILRKSSPP